MSGRISSELKAQILAECEVPGCVITEVGARHNISVGRIYNWRGNIKRLNRQKTGVSSSNKSSGFVEIAIQESEVSNVFLKKASLELQDFSLIIEGRINSKKLITLIELLGSKC